MNISKQINQMKGNYNPFSRTYQYLCFQQQKAHEKNLYAVKSNNQSNIKIIEPNQRHNLRSSKQKYYQFYNQKRSIIIEPCLAIHKNRPYENRQNQKRVQQNRRIQDKLMNTSCSVITRDASLKQYKQHQARQQIARRHPNSPPFKNYHSVNLSSRVFTRKPTDFTTKKTQKTRKIKIKTNKYEYYDHHLKLKYM